MRRFRVVLSSVVIALAICGLSAGGSLAAPGQKSLPDAWGYAVGRHPTSTSYLPGSASSGDDMGTPVGILRQETGVYAIQFPNDYPQAPNLGTVLVTAMSTTGAFCTAYDHGQQGTLEQVLVKCFDRTGAPADTKFSTSFLDDQAFTGRAAYVYAAQQSTPDYTPDPDYAFNSTGGTNTVHRVGTGSYYVHLPGLASNKGNVQVSAVHSGLCRALSWGPGGAGDQVVKVACRDEAGHLADQAFDLVFTQGQGLKQHGQGGVAYLTADQPSVASYMPAAALRFSTSGHAPHVTRSGVGRYLVTLTGLGAGGSAEVTAYGAGSSRCDLTSIATTGTVAKVGVMCTRPSGVPVDSAFGLSFVR